MTRADKVARARELRGRGMKLREIAAEMDCAFQTVHAWLSDPDGSKLRARKDSYRGTCVDCGAPTDGSNGRAKAPRRCIECAERHAHESRLWTPETIAEAIQAWQRAYGWVPRAHDWQPANAHYGKLRDADEIERRYYDESVGIWPSAQTVLRECGSWNAAVRAAGFQPRHEFLTPYRDNPERVLAEIVALYAGGATQQEIAKSYGISEARVHQLIKKARAQQVAA